MTLLQSCKEGCCSLYCALFLEESRANCCKHQIGRNIAFSHSLLILLKSLSKTASVFESHNDLRILCLLKKAQTSSVVCFEDEVQLFVLPALAMPSLPQLLCPPSSLPPPPQLFFQRPWLAASGAAAAAASAVL